MSAPRTIRSVRRPAPAGAAHGVPGWLVGLLAVASGMTVANLYYAQPLLASLSTVFHLGPAAAGTLITVTQIGYVVGMVFLVPLGDRLEKRRLVTVLLTVTTVSLAVAGFATSFPMLLIASLVSGATSVVAQILVPFAASLAPDRARGRIVGRVMSGLLAGILLSRTVSSLVSDLAGWRYVYLGSAVLMALLAVALRAALPQHAPTTSLSYGRVLRSTVQLVRTHPALRRRGLYQAAMFGAFSVFWTPSPSSSPARSTTRRSASRSSRSWARRVPRWHRWRAAGRTAASSARSRGSPSASRPWPSPSRASGSTASS